MRLAFLAALLVAACTGDAPNPYPAAAQARFEASCPPESAVCTCTWESLTRAMTYDDYEAALARFREAGLMDPRVTRARARCLEKHRE